MYQMIHRGHLDHFVIAFHRTFCLKKSAGTDPENSVSAAEVKPEISHVEWTPETVFRWIVLLGAVLRNSSLLLSLFRSIRANPNDSQMESWICWTVQSLTRGYGRQLIILRLRKSGPMKMVPSQLAIVPWWAESSALNGTLQRDFLFGKIIPS